MGSGYEASEIHENEVTEVNGHVPNNRTLGSFRIEYGEIRFEVGRASDPREVVVRIKSTGQYIQFSQRTGTREGTIVGAVLRSPGDGVLFIEEFTARVSTRPRDTVFGCRLFFDNAGERFYLHYDPNGGVGTNVEFNNFREDPVSSANVDGRCFIRRDYGNHTLFGSLFQDDLFMSYDRRRRTLVMRRVPMSRIISSAFRRIPKPFLFSIEGMRTADRGEVLPQKPARQTFLRRLIPCFRRSKSYDIN